MIYLEPTYLRYIYDGLAKGELQPSNAADLPVGLIGLYEEAFDQGKRVGERQELLERFAIWALLKKEVSAEFVAKLLHEPEEEILSFIATYSAWFNSPESGKYQLYHERLRVFILQKLSEHEILGLHESLIARLEEAIRSQNGDEFELYGLEYLGVHLAIGAMLSGDGEKLIGFVYNQSNWERQLKLSKGYSWTKNGLRAVMAWASKYNEDQLIECGLQMLDVFHKEQNGFTEIVAMVAEGDFEASLKRIDQFGGMDKEGLRRKFILYMLCLMELTLLDSKDKLYRREGILKLIKHLDEQLPVDHSILNWNEIFPSFLIFQMACEWSELGLDYLVVYRRTSYWENEWISEKGPFTERQLEVLFKSIECFTEHYQKSAALKNVYLGLAKQGRFEEALEFFKGINDESYRSFIFVSVSSSLYKEGRFEEANSSLKDALACAGGINSDWIKNDRLRYISSEYAKQGRFEEALDCVKGINDQRSKSLTLRDISSEFFKLGRVEKAEFVMQHALNCARSINGIWLKSSVLNDISGELFKQGRFENADFVMQDALNCARSINEIWQKSSVLNEISSNLFQKRMVEESAFLIKEALEFARSIDDNEERSTELKDISMELAEQGMMEEAVAVMEEAVLSARSIFEEEGGEIINMLSDICQELTKRYRVEEALGIAKSINDQGEKIWILKVIAQELVKQKRFKMAVSAMQIALGFTMGVKDDWERSTSLSNIASELSKKGRLEESLVCARGIKDERLQPMLNRISIAFAKQGRVQEALECARDCWRLINVSRVLFTHAWFEEAESFIQKALECARRINNEIALEEIAVELANQGKFERAINCAIGINNPSGKSNALNEIAIEFAKKGRLKKAASLIQQALECAKGINDEKKRSNALNKISIEFAKQGRFDEALECAKCITDERLRIYSLQEISIEFAKQGRFDEALDCARGIKDKWGKSNALNEIAIEFAKQGRFDEALDCAESILNKETKAWILLDICFELGKQGKMEEGASVLKAALAGVLNTDEDWGGDKEFAQLNISVKLAKEGLIQEALECAKCITDERLRIYSLQEIAIEFFKQGRVENADSVMQDALNCARSLNEIWEQSRALKEIAIELAKQGNISQAERISKEIPLAADWHACWEEIGVNTLKESDWSETLRRGEAIEDKNAYSIFLSAVVGHLEGVDRACIKAIMPRILDDLDSLEILF
jgi:tetratricopeptide (TPR) repeat protein